MSTRKWFDNPLVPIVLAVLIGFGFALAIITSRTPDQPTGPTTTVTFPRYPTTTTATSTTTTVAATSTSAAATSTTPVTASTPVATSAAATTTTGVAATPSPVVVTPAPCAAVWADGAPTPLAPCTYPDGTSYEPRQIVCTDSTILVIGRPDGISYAGKTGQPLRTVTDGEAADLALACRPNTEG